MRLLATAFGIFLAISLVWFGIWHSMLSADVTRVKTSIDYQYQQFRTQGRSVSLKADKVYATGFPFKFLIGIDRPTLSMVDGEETFAVSMERVTLSREDTAMGRYRIQLPPVVEALYAKSGAAPENYAVSVKPAEAMPEFYLSAEDATKRCGPLVGVKCEPVDAKQPIRSFAVVLSKSIILHMVLGAESRDAAFEFVPLNIAIYQSIPQDVSRPLQLFVGVLREALVFKTK